MKGKIIIPVLLIGALSGQAVAQTVYGFNIRGTSNFRSFDVATPLTQTTLGPAPNTVRGMDFNSSGSTLYAVTSSTTSPTNSLHTVDLSNGAFLSTVAITGLAADEAATDVLLDGAGNGYFSAFGTTNGSRLFSLDLVTGAATLIGQISATNIMIDLAMNNAGQMFAMDISTDSLWSVNTGTGLGTVIGATGFATNFAQGMDFDPLSDILYATLYTGGGTGTFASINTATGVATSLASTSSLNIEMEMAIAPVPEPMTMIAIAGLAGIVARRRLKK